MQKVRYQFNIIRKLDWKKQKWYVTKIPFLFLFNHLLYSKVKEVQKNIGKLYKQVFEDQQVESIHFEIPEALTREVYV